MELRIGPSGIGGKDEAIFNLESFAKQGIKCAEVTFTYSVYLDKESALKIGKRAKELNIVLSIHAPYFVNLNSEDKLKIEASKKRILACCEIGHYLASAWNGERKTSVVFHPGFYGPEYSKKSVKDKTPILENCFKNISRNISDLMEVLKEKKWFSELCPEVMGKRNVFGSIDEISKLVEKTDCSCCIDFAHILARYDNRRFEDIKNSFGRLKNWHCHFSGIVYGDKGEKHHRKTEETEWKEVFDFIKTLKGMREIVLIQEAPNPVEDSVEGIKLWKED